MQLTVKLPDKVYKRVERMAELLGRDAAEIIAQKLGDDLPPLPSEMDARPIVSLSDEEVLSLADSMMDKPLNSRMSDLVQKEKQALPLSDAEKAELKMLWDIYDSGQERKAEAWVEAVKRKLREPPKP